MIWASPNVIGLFGTHPKFWWLLINYFVRSTRHRNTFFLDLHHPWKYLHITNNLITRWLTGFLILFSLVKTCFNFWWLLSSAKRPSSAESLLSSNTKSYLQHRANVQYQVFRQLQKHFLDFEHFGRENHLYQVSYNRLYQDDDGELLRWKLNRLSNFKSSSKDHKNNFNDHENRWSTTRIHSANNFLWTTMNKNEQKC